MVSKHNAARWLLYALWAQVMLVLFCLGAGRLFEVWLGGTRVSLGGDVYKMTPLLAVCWLAWRILQRDRPWRGLDLLPPWALLVGLAFLSILTALDPKSALSNAQRLAGSAVLLLVLINLPWTWRGLGAALLAFLAGIGWNLALVYHDHAAGALRVQGAFIHPNSLGTFCLLALGLLSFALFATRDIRLRLLLGALLPGLVVAIFWSGSRSTYLGMLAFMGVILLIGGRRELVITGLLLGALLLFAVGNERLRERYRHTIHQLQAGAGMDRITVWTLSFELLREHPHPLGIGLGNAYNQAIRLDPAVDADPELRTLPHAHNLYLHMLIALGPAGLFALCWIFTSFFRRVLLPLMRSRETFGAGAPFLVAGTVAFLAQQLLDVPLNQLPTLVTYFAAARVVLDLAPQAALANQSVLSTASHSGMANQGPLPEGQG